MTQGRILLARMTTRAGWPVYWKSRGLWLTSKPAKQFEYVPMLRVFPVKRIGGLLKDGIRSDHSMYWRAGRKGVMITDTANFRNPNYHLPSYTPDTLDFTFIVQVAQVTAATVLEWAEIVE
jgi:hypothetical protein